MFILRKPPQPLSALQLKSFRFTSYRQCYRIYKLKSMLLTVVLSSKSKTASFRLYCGPQQHRAYMRPCYSLPKCPPELRTAFRFRDPVVCEIPPLATRFDFFCIGFISIPLSPTAYVVYALFFIRRSAFSIS